MNKRGTQHNSFGASYTNTEGKMTNIYTRCPHCGMVDYRYSAQGMNHAHHPITLVGALEKYECGGCRRQFHAIQICVPANTDPMEFYKRVVSLLDPVATTEL